MASRPDQCAVAARQGAALASDTVLEVDMSTKFLVSVIDDDPSVCEGTVDLLTSIGFAATAFCSAEAFLRSSSRDSTFCLIVDVQMPGMTGLDLYDHLIESGILIPTIVITAFPKEADRARAMRAGICCYLPKPFSEKDFLACVRAAVDAHDALQDGTDHEHH